MSKDVELIERALKLLCEVHGVTHEEDAALIFEDIKALHAAGLLRTDPAPKPTRHREQTFNGLTDDESALFIQGCEAQGHKITSHVIDKVSGLHNITVSRELTDAEMFQKIMPQTAPKPVLPKEIAEIHKRARNHSTYDSECPHADYAYKDRITCLRHITAQAQEIEGLKSETKWRCFHCDEVFTDKQEAEDHFGLDQEHRPICKIADEQKGLVEVVRGLWKKLDKFETGEEPNARASMLEFHALGAKHTVDLRNAEEAGYEKGLADGRGLHATAEAEIATMRAEVERLRKQIDTPETGNFIDGVRLEAAHQIERWGSKHDAGKTAADWFWLIGYLAGKAIQADKANDIEKLKHHIVTTAAACLNWHRAVTGEDTSMRPGIMPPDALNPTAPEAKA